MNGRKGNLSTFLVNCIDTGFIYVINTFVKKQVNSKRYLFIKNEKLIMLNIYLQRSGLPKSRFVKYLPVKRLDSRKGESSTMSKVTMTDAAYNCIADSDSEVEFAELWQEVARIMNIPADKLARKKRQFYSELMEDRRFAALKGNTWDLRSRRKYEEVHTITDIDDDADEEIEEEEDESLDLPKGEDEY